VFAPGLELGLDEEDHLAGFVFQERFRRSEDQVERDERHIADDKIHRLGQAVTCQVAGIGLFPHEDARIVPQLQVQLRGSDVDGVHARGAMLEEAVGEPAGRGADVGAHGRAGVERGPGVQRRLEFPPAPAHEPVAERGDLEGGGDGESHAGLVENGGAVAHLSRPDDALCLLTRLGQAEFHKEKVEAFFFFGGHVNPQEDG
jgi:hypothetical protein